jgi:hypothetical protein
VAGFITPDRCAIRFNDRRMTGALRHRRIITDDQAEAPAISGGDNLGTSQGAAQGRCGSSPNLIEADAQKQRNATQRSAAHLLRRPLFFTFRGSRIPRCSMRGDDGSTRIPIPPMVELAAAVLPFEQHCAVVEMAPK